MTREGRLQATQHADTEVYYMAGRQLGPWAAACSLGGWPADTPVSVVSRAGWPDSLSSDHALANLAQAALLHAGRPTVVTVGAGARGVPAAPITTLA
jgi:uroporphyrin-III C-methyltransferase